MASATSRIRVRSETLERIEPAMSQGHISLQNVQRKKKRKVSFKDETGKRGEEEEETKLTQERDLSSSESPADEGFPKLHVGQQDDKESRRGGQRRGSPGAMAKKGGR